MLTPALTASLLFAAPLTSVSFAFVNDSLGFGIAREWDDGRTFGFEGSLEWGAVRADFSYIALTDRDAVSPEANRVDQIGAHLSWRPSLETLPNNALLAEGEVRAGALLAGDFGGQTVQKAWHGLLGVARQEPTRCDAAASILPFVGFTASATLRWMRLLDGLPPRDLEPIIAAAFSAQAGGSGHYIECGARVGESGGASESALGFSYRHIFAELAGTVSAAALAKEAGFRVWWETRAGILYDASTSLIRSGLLDYQLGLRFILDSQDSKALPAHSEERRSLSVGSAIGVFAFSRTWRARLERLPGALGEHAWLAVNTLGGETGPPSDADRTGHLQIATLAAEWAGSLELGGVVLLEPFGGAGAGFRADWTYVPQETRASVDASSVVPLLSAHAGVRLLSPRADGCRYGIEAAVAFLAPLGDTADTILSSRYGVGSLLVVPSICLIAAAP